MYDLIIVGSGPSGLSAALSAQRQGLDYLVLERGTIANTIYHYPIARQLFSTSNEVELERGALPSDRKPTREEVLSHYSKVVAGEGINIHTGEEVERIEQTGEGFLVRTSARSYSARTVLLAIGGFGHQRRLNVEGEEASRVSYRFVEPHPYATKRVLVVGGGNSAAEAALALADEGAKVTLSSRAPRGEAVSSDHARFTAGLSAKIKPWVREPLERAAFEGRIRIFASSEVERILPHCALLKIKRGDSVETAEVECDHIFALIGADPDTRLLEQAGAQIAPDGRPVYDAETYETTVSGLYVAGHLTRELHMGNAISVGRKVVDAIASQILLKA